MRRRARLPAVWFALGIALLAFAWTMSNPPFSAPDEGDHYLRALSLANGHLLGPRVPYRNAGETPGQVAFARHDTRGVTVPAAMSPPGFRCLNGAPDVHGCEEATPTGDYYPLPYVLPAVAVKVASSATTGIWLARIASVIPCIVLLIVALLLVWGDGAMSILGLSAAMTPMVFFVSSVLNPSGLEICSSLSFAAAVLRVTRDAASTPSLGATRWVWAALIGSGVVLLLSFQASPAFAAFDLLLGAGFLGAGKLRTLVLDERVRSTAAAMLLVVAGVLWLIYSQSSGLAHGQFGVTPVARSLKDAVVQMHLVLYEAIGVFGSLTVWLPAAVRLPWLLLVFCGAVAAALVGNTRERSVLLVTLGAAFGFPVLADAWIYRHSGFALQARQVMPVLLLVPLVAGEILYRNAGRFDVRVMFRIELVALSGFGLLELAAWIVNARDATGAPGTATASVHPHWSPPVGWVPWIVLAAAGTICLVAAAAMKSRPKAGEARVGSVAAH